MGFSPVCWSCGLCVAKPAAARAPAPAAGTAALPGLPGLPGLPVARAAWSRRSNPASAILELGLALAAQRTPFAEAIHKWKM